MSVLNTIGHNLDKNIQTDVIYFTRRTLPKLSIPSITQVCFKSSNDMVWKAARLLGLQITQLEDLKGSFWMVLPRNGPQLHREFLRAVYLAQFYLFFLLMICQVFYRKDASSVADCERLQQALTNLHSWSHDKRDFKIRRLRTTTTVKQAIAHDQNHVTVHFSLVVLRLR